MERIDQHAAVVATRRLDDAHRLSQIAGIGPGHELQMWMQAERRG